MIVILYFSVLLNAGHITADGVFLNTSDSKVQYYREDEITFKCRYDALPVSPDSFYITNGRSKLGCFYQEGMYRQKMFDYAGEMSSPTDESCVLIPATSVPLTYELTMTFTLKDPGTYECVYEKSDSQMKSSPFNILALFDKPANLSLSVYPPGDLFAGDTIIVTCSSHSANPPSQFNYFVNTDELPGGKFTAVDSLNGMIVRCLDTVHSPYLGEVDGITTAEETITIYFLEEQQTVINIYLCVPEEIVTLNCTTKLNVPQSTSLTFTWQHNNLDILYGAQTLNFSREQPSTADFQETFLCTLTAEPFGFTRIQFNVLWNTSQPCADMLSSSEEKKLSICIVMLVITISLVC